MYLNPEWVRLSKAINDKMLADFNQKLKQGYDNSRGASDRGADDEATGRFPGELRQQEEAFRNSGRCRRQLSSGWRQAQCCRPLGDVIRGVDTVNDPSTGGTTQLSNWVSITSRRLRQLPHQR